ncbi:MAG: PIG-L family deacetylase [Candidatus Omnitrophica bacterium]|nr:PIG-L family deacetylase [Candidatus Omnitrophota bacterium]MCM8802930.1 PIG-L family deacetylase [Candidatus Omnitrophota bacterium]
MNYEKIIVFGAHPDDEITMAGTIFKMSSSGKKVIVVTMTDGCEGYSDPEIKEKIVEIRRKEAEECDKVLGISKRIMLNIPDMALINDKETLKKCIKIIREEKPDAIFTHGPCDNHRDHITTHFITVEARWHAGEPVSSELGNPWYTPYLYYYKGILSGLPSIIIDVTDVEEKRYEALITQVSQFKIFRKNKEDFLSEIEFIKKYRPKRTEKFWIADKVILYDFLPI